MKKIFLAALLGVTSLSTWAAPEATDKNLTQAMKKAFPGTPITSAQFVDGVSGLVELVVGKNKIIYSNEAGDKVFIGHIYNPKTNQDLTQLRINSLSKIDYNKLPFAQSFPIKKGDGSREFAVFTDVDCSFCKKLESELAKVTNYTMHVFLFPLSIHSGALGKSVNIFCAETLQKNGGEVLRDYMLRGVTPPMVKGCDIKQTKDLISENVKFGFQEGISGTPFLIGKNGVSSPGYMPAEKLEVWLNANGGRGELR